MFLDCPSSGARLTETLRVDDKRGRLTLRPIYRAACLRFGEAGQRTGPPCAKGERLTQAASNLYQVSDYWLPVGGLTECA
jgi:hypothetical protein